MKRVMFFLVLCLLLSGCGAPSGSDCSNEAGAASNSVSQQPEPERIAATLYIPNTVEGWAGWQDYLMDVELEIEDSPQGVIDGLIGLNAIPKDVKVNSFTQTENTVVLDLSEEFRIAVNDRKQWHMGLDSVVDTFLLYYQMDAITLLIDGEPIPGLEEPQELYLYD